MKIILLAIITLLFSACGESEESKLKFQQLEYDRQALQHYTVQTQQAQAYQPQMTQPATPIVIQQALQQTQMPQDTMVRDMMLGGMIGHAVGSFGGSNSSPPQIINRTYVNAPYVTPSTPITQYNARSFGSMDMNALSRSSPRVGR